MQSKKEKLISMYENEVLELIDNQDDYTRSDLQGIVYAIVAKIVREAQALKD
jgi:hypothetical protein